MDNTKEYAPIIIPTLNRYEHLKRCLESLERCKGANYTDVYVALDYPPSIKYVDGWEKINAYLQEKEINNKFGHLYVIRRERNYGVNPGYGNSSVLLKEIREKYEYYIFSEDDNEFSRSFLEYMNACLVRFIDDERIVKVCGYNFPMQMPNMYKNNFYISKRYCAWGMASWTKKLQPINKYYDFDLLCSILRNNSTYNRLKKIYPRGINLIYSMLKHRKFYGDAISEIYAYLEDKYFILPTVSKVRNHGNDGTGVHSLRMNKEQNKFYSEQFIDQSADFEFTNDIFSYEPINLENDNFIPRTTLKSIYKIIVMEFDIWLLRHFNFLPKSKYI